jgi:hypothetical protein
MNKNEAEYVYYGHVSDEKNKNIPEEWNVRILYEHPMRSRRLFLRILHRCQLWDLMHLACGASASMEIAAFRA